MSNQSFEEQMKKIAVHDAALRVHEAKLARQAELKGRIVKIVIAVVLLGVLVAGWQYRDSLQKVASENLQPTKATIDGGTGQALKGIQESAAKRDAVLDSLNMAAPATNKAKAK
jgi:hypothetical protein